jgi:3-hydroxyacyl-[acyl-carrier-protein] dehydratase
VSNWHVEADACWEYTHPHLPGHFPGLPIVPGVFLIEAAAQAVGVVLGIAPSKDDERDRLAVLTGVKACRLHHMVRPGDAVRFQINVQSLVEGKYFEATGTAHGADGVKVMNVELNVAMVSRNEVTGAQTAPR